MSGTRSDAGRVLIIVQNLPVPFDRRVWLEATTLTSAGYAVSVICPKGKGFEASRETLDGVDIYRYPVPFEAAGFLGFAAEFSWCFIWTALLSLRVALHGKGFDVIHACNPPDTYWLLARCWRLTGKRFIYDQHDLCPEMYGAKYADRRSPIVVRGLELLERATFRTADAVVTTNESHRRIAETHGGVDRERTFVVRSGPDLERLRRRPPDAALKRGKPHLIVYLGEMCVQDGVEYLVRTVRVLRDQLGRADFHCMFVGGGPHQPAVQATAEAEGVADLCTFTGRVSDEDLARILSSADVGVDPVPKTDWSDRSTMNKIVEYMFFGLPIVCFDLTEHRVSAGDAAVYATPNEVVALAREISRVLDEPRLRARMSEVGVRRVHDELAWEHSTPHLLAAYRAVFDGVGPT